MCARVALAHSSTPLRFDLRTTCAATGGTSPRPSTSSTSASRPSSAPSEDHTLKAPNTDGPRHDATATWSASAALTAATPQRQQHGQRQQSTHDDWPSHSATPHPSSPRPHAEPPPAPGGLFSNGIADFVALCLHPGSCAAMLVSPCLPGYFTPSVAIAATPPPPPPPPLPPTRHARVLAAATDTDCIPARSLPRVPPLPRPCFGLLCPASAMPLANPRLWPPLIPGRPQRCLSAAPLPLPRRRACARALATLPWARAVPFACPRPSGPGCRPPAPSDPLVPPPFGRGHLTAQAHARPSLRPACLPDDPRTTVTALPLRSSSPLSFPHAGGAAPALRPQAAARPALPSPALRCSLLSQLSVPAPLPAPACAASPDCDGAPFPAGRIPFA